MTQCTQRARPFLAVVLLAAVFFAPTRAAAGIRLSHVAIPTFESITLDLDADSTDYTGSVRIDLTVAEKTREIQFHAEEMSLDRVELAGDKGAVSLECEVGEDGLVTARAASDIDPGEYHLEVDFSKPYNTRAVGLYRVVEDGRGYLFSQFESIDARKAFPCFDEPVYKIRWRNTIRIPAGQTIVTNSPVETQSELDGIRTVVFRELPPTPSYLLAYAAGPLESVPIEGMSVPGRVYCTQGKSRLASIAAQMAPQALSALETWFDRAYPYEKLDLIAIPEYWPGAMENPGAVTYKDGILLLDPDNASVGQRRLLARVTVHEFAHMWFGDLVTMSWWDDLWLNESFADWLGDKISNQLYPAYGIEIQELQGIQNTMNNDARPSSSAIRRPVEDDADLNEDVMLAYDKGKTVLRMVEMWVGEEVFRRGVLDYIDAHLWGNTVAQDLFDAVSNASEVNVTPVLASFLDQPGYPLVTAEVETGGVVRLSQQRFFNAGAEGEPLRWTVPVRLEYSDGKGVYTRTVLLDDESRSVELAPHLEWVHANAGSDGYYRWRTNADMMYRMAENPDILDARERATFLANADALLDAGAFSGDEYLRLLSAFARSPEPEVVTGVMASLGSVQGAFVTSELEAPFAVYVRNTLRPALERIGIEPRADEDEADTLLRPRLFAWLGGRGDDDEVVNYCRTVADRFLDDPSAADAQIAGVSLRVAARHGDAALFERVRAGFESASEPAHRRAYLNALGSFADPALQDRALEYALGGKVRINELFQLYRPMLETPEGQDRVYNWVTSHYDELMSRMPPMFAQFMPFIASGCSSERLAAAREFFADPERDSDGVRKTLAKVSDQVGDCVNLREREGPAVAEYLEGFASAH